jgi:DNA polymerase I-like protein with 3'-5' exonuclease and polymerase domains
LEGDIHQFNADKMGIERGPGKGVMYATLYGAGDVLVGKLVGGGRREGRTMRTMLEDGIPALKKLKSAIANRLQTQDWLPAIDGRKLPIRSEHSALNLLLQSAGSILMKRATIIMDESIKQNQLSANQIMHVHDEVQFEVLESEADDVGRIAVQAMREAGKPYEFRCPLDGEYKIGSNWAETH